MRYLILSIFFLLAPSLTLADAIKDIQWIDLIPAEHRKDPLEHLPEEERDHVEWIVYLRQNLPEKITEEEKKFHQEMTEAIPKLKAKGIDVDKIIAKREKRDDSLNSELDGKRVRLPGYVLPLDVDGELLTEFLLVPYVGACIHVPPPPRNQIVHATVKKPIERSFKQLFTPIQAVGVLKTTPMSKELFLMDGSDDVNIGYTMEIEVVEPYKPEQTKKGQ